MEEMYAKKGQALLAQQDDNGNYAIHLASWKGQVSAVTRVLEWGGIDEVDRCNKNNNTAFHFAASSGYVDVMEEMYARKGQALLTQQERKLCNPSGFWKGHVSAVTRVLEWGGIDELDRRNKNNNTPFHFAASSGCVKVMEEMYAKEGQTLLTQQDQNGNYAIHLASLNDHVSAVTRVVEWGGVVELDRRNKGKAHILYQLRGCLPVSMAEGCRMITHSFTSLRVLVALR